MKILVTGGAGFIGSAVIRHIIRETGDGHFEYSFRGLLFLWGQFVKDMVRLC